MPQEVTHLSAAPLALTIPEEKRKEAFANNCASGEITEFDLPRIKVNPGTALWLIPSLEGDNTRQAIEGVVVCARDTRVYYESKVFMENLLAF